MGSMELKPCDRLFCNHLHSIHLRDFPRRGIENQANHIDRMAGADHRREGLFAGGTVRAVRREGSNPPALREAKRRSQRPVARLFAHLFGILRLDASGSERLCNPPLAIATPLQRCRASGGECRIVNVAETGKPLDQCVNLGRSLPLPAAFANLALEVEAQPGARGRVAADIEESETLERLFVQRPCRPSPSPWCHAP